MLKFKQFLIEAEEQQGKGKQIELTGSESERRIRTYAEPFYNTPVDQSPFSLHGTKRSFDETGRHKHLGLMRGDPVVVTGHSKNDKGQNQFHVVHPETGETIIMPSTHLRVLTGESGKHNPEHAVSALWNHYSGKSAPSVSAMHKEIEKAKTDPLHKLNIQNADVTGFIHSVSDNETAHKTYYQNLRDAAHSIVALAGHEDYKQLFDQGASMSVIGGTRGHLTHQYIQHGVKEGSPAATPKTDGLVITGKRGTLKTLSLKQVAREQQPSEKTGKPRKPKKVGSQIMSSSPEEAKAVYSVAIERMFGDLPKTQNNIALAKRSKQILNQFYKAASQTTKKHPDAESNVEQANNHLNTLHQLLDRHGLRAHVLHEALTGQGKFPDPQHIATHLVEIGPGAQVYSLGNHPSQNQYIKAHDTGGPNFVSVGGSKTHNAPQATRIRSLVKK